MRVVAGKYKGYNLLSPKSNTSRPTDNKVKEAIFDMLYPIKENAFVLDLFAGTGQIGIEFLSRGVGFVYFNERDRINFNILKENLDKLDCDNYDIIKGDYEVTLSNLHKKGIRFDYIFLDPPYDKDYIEKSIEIITRYELLNHDGIVITESDRDLRFDDKYNLYLFKEKTYGRKLVNIYIK